jgi:hypothetical protein
MIVMAITSPRATERQFDTPPLTWGSMEIPEFSGFSSLPLIFEAIRENFKSSSEHRRILAYGGQLLFDGKINATGSISLTPSSTTTTLIDRRIGNESTILFMPTTANAAAALTNLYVSSTGKQTATLTHASNSQTRTFKYVVIG